jgi:hypothetical protein
MKIHLNGNHLPDRIFTTAANKIYEKVKQVGRRKRSDRSTRSSTTQNTINPARSSLSNQINTFNYSQNQPYGFAPYYTYAPYYVPSPIQPSLIQQAHTISNITYESTMDAL